MVISKSIPSHKSTLKIIFSHKFRKKRRHVKKLAIFKASFCPIRMKLDETFHEVVIFTKIHEDMKNVDFLLLTNFWTFVAFSCRAKSAAALGTTQSQNFLSDCRHCVCVFLFLSDCCHCFCIFSFCSCFPSKISVLLE